MSTSGLGKLYTDGQVIVRQGEAGDCMFAVQEGRLEVLKVGKDGEVRVGILEQGDIFGEMSIFEREARSATIRVLGQARILTVDKKTFLRRIQEDPTIAFNLVRMMSRRIRVLSQDVAEGKIDRSPHGARTQMVDKRRKERRSVGERRKGGDRRTTSERRRRA